MTGVLHVLRLLAVVAIVVGAPAALVASAIGYVRDAVERAAIALGAALCVVIVTGLLLGAAHGGFGFAGWAVALGVVLTVLGVLVRRRIARVPPRLAARPAAGVGLALAFAVAAAVAGVAVARSGATQRTDETPWVELWIHPIVSKEAHYVIVGASAHHSQQALYDIEVRDANGRARTFADVELPDGREWRVRIRVGGAVSVDAALRQVGGAVTRRVHVAPDAWRGATGR